MSAQKEKLFVRVTDMAGNKFVCPIDALKRPGEVTEDDLKTASMTQQLEGMPETSRSLIRFDFKTLHTNVGHQQHLFTKRDPHAPAPNPASDPRGPVKRKSRLVKAPG